mgnify:CR=1 FL=1
MNMYASDHTFAICAYGESPYLEECVKSLAAQTVPSEVFIATSTDCTFIRNIAERYDLDVLVNPNGPGICEDWNFAVKNASKRYVTIAHQDDTYEPDYCRKMLLAGEKYNDLLIYFTNYGEIRRDTIVDDDRLLSVKRRLLKPLTNPNKRRSAKAQRSVLRFGSSICCPSVTLDTNNIPLPLFTNEMKSNLDWQAWERLTHTQGAFYYDPTILMHHRIHDGSETSRLIKDDTRTKEDLAMLEKFWPVPLAKIINMFYRKGQHSNSLREAGRN